MKSAPPYKHSDASPPYCLGPPQVDVFRLPGAPHTPVFTGHTVLKVSIGTAT